MLASNDTQSFTVRYRTDHSVRQAQYQSAKEQEADVSCPLIDCFHTRRITMFRVIFILLAFISLSATAALTGCHTMSGAGQDIEQGGEAISDEADKHTD